MIKQMPTDKQKALPDGHRQILFAVGLVALIYFLWKVSGIIIGLFISYLIMTAVNPLVLILEKVKISRKISGLVILIAILALLASGIAALIPPVVDQTSAFLSHLPRLLRDLGVQLDNNLISSQLGSIPQNAFKVISGAFSNALTIFAILIVSYYFIIERPLLPKKLVNIFGAVEEKHIENILVKVEGRLGGWIRGQLSLCFIIGLAAYLGLAALSIPYTIPLAIIAGILEAIPNIGPTVSMIPAAIVGFTISPLHGAAVILLYFLIQQFENYLIVPMVMRKALGLNPLITLVVLMVGLNLGGPLGAILAIPLFLTGEVVLPHFFHRPLKN